MLQHEIIVYENDTRLGIVEEMCVFGIRKKREGTRTALFDFGKCRDGSVFVALYLTADKLGYLLSFKLHKLGFYAAKLQKKIKFADNKGNIFGFF